MTSSNLVVVVGCTSTTLRLVDELISADRHVIVLAPGTPEPWMLEELEQSRIEVVPTPLVRESLLRQVGVERAECVVVLGQDDIEAMRVALLVEEVAPRAKLVLEMGNPALSDTLSTLLGQCIVLSSAELAAPSFVSASLAGGEVDTFDLAGRRVVAGSRSRVGGSTLAVLGNSRGRGVRGLLGSEGDVLLGTEVLKPLGRHRARQTGLFGALTQAFDRRLRWVVAVLVALMLGSTFYFHVFAGLDWYLAFYAAVTASTLTGIGDIGDLSLAARFGAVLIQLVGLVLSSGITAVIVDALLSARLSALAGGVRGKPNHHVVVCGLGRIGTVVARELRSRAVPVVAIERSEHSPGVGMARRAKIPVIIAEATDRQALEQAGVTRAEAVLAVTDNDAANLEIAMVAKHVSPEVRVVTRLFDHELAERVERRLALGATRSVSMLAGPAFAAAVLDRGVERVVSVGRRVVILTEITIATLPHGDDSSTIAQISEPHRCLVLAHRRAGEPWSWVVPSNTTVRVGDQIAVAASRIGLANLGAKTQRT